MQDQLFSYFSEMKKTWPLLLCIFFHVTLHAQSVQIIPQPSEAKLLAGNPFVITKNTPFFFVSGRALATVMEFNALLKKTYGFELSWITEVTDHSQKFIFLHLTKDSTIQKEEGYKIDCNEDFIKITATTRAGMFYGMVSVLQMMQPGQDGDGSYTVPACTIHDEPRFAWRGMHLDVCRHFFGKEFIKKYIDLLALHKMNTFHWHLTEDQGWRIEIKKYPLLTEVGAWRNGSMVGRYSDHIIDTIRYGGYYTQDDIREIVKYAASRHITIVPEIEMPGHALAALAAYPSLSCTGGPFEVAKEWGVFEDVYCAGNENTFTFIEDVLTEICALFPGKYIHIGGDECPKERWKTCPRCQKRIKDEGLKDEHELQSYFIRRIEKFLNTKGKQVIGWDEILEGGLAPNAAVMSWRGEQGGIEAATQQHPVVMSPGTYCYFDHYQGDPELEPIAIGGYTPIEKVYAYEPVPAALPDSLAGYILGAQGNVWTEYITGEKQVEYMALPRMCALAEVLWSPKEKRDLDSFSIRLLHHLNLLDLWQVNHANSIFQTYQEVYPVIHHASIKIQTHLPSLNDVEYRFIPFISSADSAWIPEKSPVYYDMSQSGTLESRTKGCNLVVKTEFHISKSTAKPISYSTPPSQYYNTDPDFTLVNGIKADLPRRNNQWNAWSGEDVEITIDLLSIQEIQQVEIGYLQDVANWIWLPEEITITGSANGKKYKPVAILNAAAIQQNPRQVLAVFKKQKIRYIKIRAKNPGPITEGNPGAGSASWLFFDEIGID